MGRSQGSLNITNFPTDRMEVECKKCGRHGRHWKATLVEKYGSDTVLFDLCVRVFFAKENPKFKHS